jgi:hypothetical protein
MGGIGLTTSGFADRLKCPPLNVCSSAALRWSPRHEAANAVDQGRPRCIRNDFVFAL